MSDYNSNFQTHVKDSPVQSPIPFGSSKKHNFSKYLHPLNSQNSGSLKNETST